MNLQQARELARAGAISVSLMLKKWTEGEQSGSNKYQRGPGGTAADLGRRAARPIFSGAWANLLIQRGCWIGRNNGSMCFFSTFCPTSPCSWVPWSHLWLFTFGQFRDLNTVRLKSLSLWVSPFPNLKQFRLLPQAPAEVRFVFQALETTTLWVFWSVRYFRNSAPL